MISEISLASMVLGTALCGIGVLGVLRLPDFMNRLHATTIIVTLGTLFLLLPVGLASIQTRDWGYAKSAFILLAFTWVGGAVGSHALARSMFLKGQKPSNLVKDQMEEDRRD